MKIYGIHEDFIMHGLKYYINTGLDGYFASCISDTNSAIFTLLKIEDKYGFCSNIVGYDVPRIGKFPYFKTLVDINKVIHVLMHYGKNPNIIPIEIYTNF